MPFRSLLPADNKSGAPPSAPQCSGMYHWELTEELHWNHPLLNCQTRIAKQNAPPIFRQSSSAPRPIN